ncbi:hypothetical protein ACROYT_G015646 [Oculina patagonica]
MAFRSFGGEEDPCGAVEWAAHDSSMVPLQHCKRDMCSWLKEKYGGSGASGSRGRPTSKSSDLIQSKAVDSLHLTFSRLAALQKGQEVSEEDTACEDAAIEREELLQDLIKEAQKQIDLQHPLMYEKINLCELFVANKLDHALRKFKLCTLKAMCNSFGVDVDGPATRKAPFITTVFELVKFCQCQCK